MNLGPFKSHIQITTAFQVRQPGQPVFHLNHLKCACNGANSRLNGCALPALPAAGVLGAVLDWCSLIH
jgi:hypothetical protein